jgi:CheY-like chemotaxis protein
MRPVDVSIIVKEALQLLRASLPSTIQIRQDVSRATVVADASQIHQVVINLCTNAAHAMADMGILEVTLHEVDLSAEDLVNLSITGLKPGMHLELSVKDTGAGMSRDTMQKIFDPYFTTKEVGKGTGLGLAVVHGIINRHGGEILVRSEVGRGSVFDIYIPSAERTPQRERPGADDLPKGSGRVLVVDDEPAIATMVARMLERLGYSVAATTSPKEALDLFRSQPDRFDLVLTDYTMPQMVGTELANECMRIRADIPVIICSGYSERLNNEQPDKPGVKEIVMKPLNLEQLATVVRSVLNKTSD